ncbi:hypothetical protein [Streptomyces sp. FH025]|uniref:hypothetical protein n=1 Tax=Streptomyces sp. FH025 TaxID=2815937 RepID=UPI001A9FF351|nr:hypothetical protein [Streptomyces sp. FH025]MBO1413338.1 hypothetical protein [Streptomyces sp. FH025]
MSQLAMAAYGLVGSLLVSLLTFFRVVQTKRCWPWEVPGGTRISIYIAAEAARMLIGAGVAWAIAMAGPFSAFGAVIAGAGAPAILDKWQRSAQDSALSDVGQLISSIPAQELSSENQAVGIGPSMVGDGGA